MSDWTREMIAAALASRPDRRDPGFNRWSWAMEARGAPPEVYRRCHRVTGRPGSVHEEKVSELVAEFEARTSSLTKKLRDLGVMKSLKPEIRPDAWHLDHLLGIVTAFEVEVKSPLKARKIEKYEEMRAILASEGWALVVVRVGRDGDRRPLWECLPA